MLQAWVSSLTVLKTANLKSRQWCFEQIVKKLDSPLIPCICMVYWMAPNFHKKSDFSVTVNFRKNNFRNSIHVFIKTYSYIASFHVKIWGSSYTRAARNSQTRFIIEFITDWNNSVLIATYIGWKSATLSAPLKSRPIALAIDTVTVILQK